MEEMPDDLDSEEGVEFHYRAQREMQSPVASFPSRAFTPVEAKQYLEDHGYDLDVVTVWVPNESGLEHDGLVEHRESAEGDILRLYVEHDTRMELYTLLPMGDGSFQWHHNDSASDSFSGRAMSSMKKKFGWRELDAVLEDGEYPEIPDRYTSAASFFNAETTHEEYIPYLPEGWCVTQATRVEEQSELLHPVYNVTVVHEPSGMVVFFRPADTDQYDEYTWEVDVGAGVSLPTDELRGAYGEIITGEDAVFLIESLTNAL